jgi:hypothetical protein
MDNAGIFMANWNIFGHLVKFLVIWFIFSRFGEDVLPNYVNGFKINHLATLMDPT